MTVKDVLLEVKRIRDLAHDDEGAHHAEDILWCRVLKAISKGEQNPQQLATAALLTRRISFSRWYA